MDKDMDISVSVVMGSDSDYPVMEEAVKILKAFEVSHEVFLTSAHRSPDRTSDFARKAVERNVKVIIVGAGAAAHLAGVIASQTTLPVIGVPIDSTALNGLDALLATVQMPGGIPVATMAIGKAGAKNAALFAIRILSLTDAELRQKLDAYIADMARDVERKQEDLVKKIRL
ncbi:MAG: N5-carboxyaminoimidazole ribonucleotide mutase [Syntrophus sp. PtaB.Bin001]|nr:MAG: N5-carboxyaminoimidazole ribonucleotide mutase [Syntrophus sp. PtaB.Bin001]